MIISRNKNQFSKDKKQRSSGFVVALGFLLTFTFANFMLFITALVSHIKKDKKI